MSDHVKARAEIHAELRAEQQKLDRIKRLVETAFEVAVVRRADIQAHTQEAIAALLALSVALDEMAKEKDL